jgi:hypothetical protein
LVNEMRLFTMDELNHLDWMNSMYKLWSNVMKLDIHLVGFDPITSISSMVDEWMNLHS